jgi:hypothetical protein
VFYSTACLEINLTLCQESGHRIDTKRSGFSQQSARKLIRQSARELDTESTPNAVGFNSTLRLEINSILGQRTGHRTNTKRSGFSQSRFSGEINLTDCQGTGHGIGTKRSGFSQQSAWKLI